MAVRLFVSSETGRTIDTADAVRLDFAFFIVIGETQGEARIGVRRPHTEKLSHGDRM
jgi:hypothetical protein